MALTSAAGLKLVDYDSDDDSSLDAEDAMDLDTPKSCPTNPLNTASLSTNKLSSIISDESSEYQYSLSDDDDIIACGANPALLDPLLKSWKYSVASTDELAEEEEKSEGDQISQLVHAMVAHVAEHLENQGRGWVVQDAPDDEIMVLDHWGFRNARPGFESEVESSVGGEVSSDESDSSFSSVLSDLRVSGARRKKSSSSGSDSDECFKKILEQAAKYRRNVDRPEAPSKPRPVEVRMSKSKAKRTQGARVRGELSVADLPPIEQLRISVEDNVKLLAVGKVTSIMDCLVIILSNFGIPALDENSVFFTSDRVSLGKVFEIFGPVTRPLYSIRFNSLDELKPLGLGVGSIVYCAPEVLELTKSVFTDALLKIKGSDASWEENIEAPPEAREFSDDEEERQFRAQARAKHHHRPSGAPGEESFPGLKRGRGAGPRRRPSGRRGSSSGHRGAFNFAPPSRGGPPPHLIQRVNLASNYASSGCYPRSGFQPRQAWPPSGSGYGRPPPPIYPPPTSFGQPPPFAPLMPPPRMAGGHFGRGMVGQQQFGGFGAIFGGAPPPPPPPPQQSDRRFANRNWYS